MLVTINTDASYSHDYRFGAFAYWIRCDTGKLFARGPLKGEIKYSYTAEFMAVVKAIHRLANSKWKGIDRIIINTDCQIVIHYMTDANKSKKVNKELYSIWLIYLELIKTEKLKNADIEFRHVKAHCQVNDARKWANDWCDQSAKLSLREMVTDLKKKHDRTTAIKAQ